MEGGGKEEESRGKRREGVYSDEYEECYDHESEVPCAEVWMVVIWRAEWQVVGRRERGTVPGEQM